MAKFYPTIDKDFHGSDGEKLVYDALHSLNDTYTIFHSFCWLGNEQQRRSEGEADFVILHPQKGILSLEVKAGGIDYRDGNWIQINRQNGSEKIIDPLGQAAESQHHILYLLRQRLPHLNHPPVGRAAWFTSVLLDKKLPLPPSAAPAILLDMDSLHQPADALDQAFAYWQKNLGWCGKPLSSGDFSQIIKTLMPSFHIAPAIGSIIREDADRYIRMTQQQSAILQFLSEQPTAAIHGLAGTGKTLLAIEKTRLLAADGQQVLYLCFNEFLLQYLRTHYQDIPQITFHNVRSLANEIIGPNDFSIAEIIPAFEQYFDEAYDDTLWPYPNIVIDEGQDLDDCLLEHLACLMELTNGTFYIFYDRNQAIMKNTDRQEIWIDQHADCRLILYKNCRNTAEIAATIGSLLHTRTSSYINDLHGIAPTAAFYTDTDSLIALASRFLRHMLHDGVKLEDIAILSIHSLAHSALQGITELAGIPLSASSEPGRLWFTSVRKFKGLEAKAVLLIDIKISELTSLLIQRLIYVGCSRANTCLYAAIHEDLPRSSYQQIIPKLTEEPLPGNRKSLLKILGMVGE